MLRYLLFISCLIIGCSSSNNRSSKYREQPKDWEMYLKCGNLKKNDRPSKFIVAFDTIFNRQVTIVDFDEIEGEFLILIKNYSKIFSTNLFEVEQAIHELESLLLTTQNETIQVYCRVALADLYANVRQEDASLKVLKGYQGSPLPLVEYLKSFYEFEKTYDLDIQALKILIERNNCLAEKARLLLIDYYHLNEDFVSEREEISKLEPSDWYTKVLLGLNSESEFERNKLLNHGYNLYKEEHGQDNLYLISLIISNSWFELGDYEVSKYWEDKFLANMHLSISFRERQILIYGYLLYCISIEEISSFSALVDTYPSLIQSSECTFLLWEKVKKSLVEKRFSKDHFFESLDESWTDEQECKEDLRLLR